MDYQKRISPFLVTELKENEIFVFGDNESHIHGKGAAKTAMRFGAKYGKGGPCGKTYGIPTKGKSVQVTLTLHRIKKYVDEFITYAKENPDKIFLVTSIGCGLAGYKETDIAPLFKEAIDINNIHLPASFWKVLNNKELTSE